MRDAGADGPATPRITIRDLAPALAVAAAFGVVATAYALAVPFPGAADEPSHLGYARLVADHAALPGPTVPEKQQPPLYYLAGAVLLKAGSGPTGLRLLSVSLGVATLCLTAVLALVLFPGRRGLAALAAGSLAVLPGVAAVDGAVSDDPLAWCAGAALLLLIALVVLAVRPTVPLALGAGVVAGIGLLAKETDWPMVAVLAVAAVASWWGRLRPATVAALLVPPLAIAGWWFARNLAGLHAIVPPLAPLTGRGPVLLRSPGQLRGVVSQTVRSLFGPETPLGAPLGRSTPAGVLVVLAVTALTALAATGLAVHVRGRRHLDRRRRLAITALAACAALAVAAALANDVTYDLQPQARYLVVAGPVGALAVAVGVDALWRRIGARRATLALVALAAVLAAAGVDALRLAIRAGT